MHGDVDRLQFKPNFIQDQLARSGAEVSDASASPRTVSVAEEGEEAFEGSRVADLASPRTASGAEDGEVPFEVSGDEEGGEALEGSGVADQASLRTNSGAEEGEEPFEVSGSEEGEEAFEGSGLADLGSPRTASVADEGEENANPVADPVLAALQRYKTAAGSSFLANPSRENTDECVDVQSPKAHHFMKLKCEDIVTRDVSYSDSSPAHTQSPAYSDNTQICALGSLSYQNIGITSPGSAYTPCLSSCATSFVVKNSLLSATRDSSQSELETNHTWTNSKQEDIFPGAHPKAGTNHACLEQPELQSQLVTNHISSKLNGDRVPDLHSYERFAEKKRQRLRECQNLVAELGWAANMEVTRDDEWYLLERRVMSPPETTGVSPALSPPRRRLMSPREITLKPNAYPFSQPSQASASSRYSAGIPGRHNSPSCRPQQQQDVELMSPRHAAAISTQLQRLNSPNCNGAHVDHMAPAIMQDGINMPRRLDSSESSMCCVANAPVIRRWNSPNRHESPPGRMAVFRHPTPNMMQTRSPSPGCLQQKPCTPCPGLMPSGHLTFPTVFRQPDNILQSTTGEINRLSSSSFRQPVEQTSPRTAPVLMGAPVKFGMPRRPGEKEPDVGIPSLAAGPIISGGIPKEKDGGPSSSASGQVPLGTPTSITLLKKLHSFAEGCGSSAPSEAPCGAPLQTPPSEPLQSCSAPNAFSLAVAEGCGCSELLASGASTRTPRSEPLQTPLAPKSFNFTEGCDSSAPSGVPMRTLQSEPQQTDPAPNSVTQAVEPCRLANRTNQASTHEMQNELELHAEFAAEILQQSLSTAVKQEQARERKAREEQMKTQQQNFSLAEGCGSSAPSVLPMRTLQTEAPQTQPAPNALSLTEGFESCASSGALMQPPRTEPLQAHAPPNAFLQNSSQIHVTPPATSKQIPAIPNPSQFSPYTPLQLAVTANNAQHMIEHIPATQSGSLQIPMHPTPPTNPYTRQSFGGNCHQPTAPPGVEGPSELIHSTLGSGSLSLSLSPPTNSQALQIPIPPNKLPIHNFPGQFPTPITRQASQPLHRQTSQPLQAPHNLPPQAFSAYTYGSPATPRVSTPPRYRMELQHIQDEASSPLRYVVAGSHTNSARQDGFVTPPRYRLEGEEEKTVSPLPNGISTPLQHKVQDDQSPNAALGILCEWRTPMRLATTQPTLGLPVPEMPQNTEAMTSSDTCIGMWHAL